MKNYLLIIMAFFTFNTVNAQTGVLTSGSINVNGTNRTFKIYVPAIYNGTTSVPLLFNFHGFGITNTTQLSYGEFRPIADTANFIMVLPQALGSTPRWETFSSTPNTADMTFIDSLVSYMDGNYNIDINRVYATGMSNGGFISYDLAAFSNKFTAIGSVAGDMTNTHKNTASPAHLTPIMEIHGTKDLTVPWKGGTANKYANIDSLILFWLTFNGCNPTPVVTTLPNINTTDGSTVDKIVYNNPTGGGVVLLKIVNGGHTWPGATTTTGGGSGYKNMDINASLEIWKFVSKYSLSSPR